MSSKLDPAVETPEVLIFGRQLEDAPSGSATLLVVDDDHAVRTAVRRLLQRYGYVVLEADSGAAALQLLRDAAVQIDLVLTDVVMPGMSGIEFVQQMKVEFPAIPAVYISGHLDEPSVHDGTRGAEQWVLAKPLSLTMLVATVRSALEYGAQHDRHPKL
jgi:two-component system cell cycle sensor histidine kinase/response regulator CckA